MKKAEIIRDGKIENIRQKPFDHNDDVKPERSKWFKRLRTIISFITDIFS